MDDARKLVSIARKQENFVRKQGNVIRKVANDVPYLAKGFSHVGNFIPDIADDVCKASNLAELVENRRFMPKKRPKSSI